MRSNRQASQRVDANGEPAQCYTSDGESPQSHQAQAKPADANGAESHPADRNDACREPSEGDDSNRQITDSYDAYGTSPILLRLEIRTDCDRDHRNVADNRFRLIAHNFVYGQKLRLVPSFFDLR